MMGATVTPSAPGIGSASLCFTCGDGFPRFGGAIPLKNNAIATVG
jgi:hypothetical protein